MPAMVTAAPALRLGCAASLALAGEFHAHKHSPLGRAEALDEAVADPQLEPQMCLSPVRSNRPVKSPSKPVCPL
jgi:hypothetical protein